MDTGTVYVVAGDMQHTRTEQLRGGNDKPNNFTLDDYHSFLYYFVVNLFTAGRYGIQTIKSKMATLAFKYMLLHVFGGFFGLYGFLEAVWPNLLADVQLNDLPAPARWVFMLLGAAYIFYIIMNARENYRKKRIDNDERENELKKKHLREVKHK
jgi:hypothetical protein